MKVTIKNIKTNKEKTYNNVYRVNVRYYHIYLQRDGKDTIKLDKEKYCVFVEEEQKVEKC